ncbi:MAG: Holliday junction resolvase RuvX [Flavobacteriales bacterium]|nr:Holliday junction resolvase RuvX [Flavobacteriales bacterium]
MSRILALDHGLKRTGIAVTDPLRIIATALDTVATKDCIAFLKAYLAKEQVEGFVIGLPMGLNGRPTDATAGVLAFLKTLKSAFPEQWIETMDERFTSKMAQQTLQDSGVKKMARREKGQLDRISATLILQSWMEGGGTRV